MEPMNMNPAQLRELLVCPISYVLLQDPVTEGPGTCGHTFEKVCIEEWLVNRQTCPCSRDPLTLNQLVPNPRLRDACDLLNPARVVPITPEELSSIRNAAQRFSERVAPPVPQEVHDSIMKRVAQKVSEKSLECKQVTEDFYSPQQGSCIIL